MYFSTEGADYWICGDGLAFLYKITKSCDHFVVPSVVISPENKEYQIIGISKRDQIIPWKQKIFHRDLPVNIISFDEALEIDVIRSSFIFCNKSTILLPQGIKRIKSDNEPNSSDPIVILDNNKFVSIFGKRNIMNHHPLEIFSLDVRRTHILFRETIKIIGKNLFLRNQIIKSVIFPASVEEIESNAFGHCYNLRHVFIKRCSKLRKIGHNAFNYTLITKLTFPASIERIGDYAFYNCYKLAYVSFPSDSNLKEIGFNAFDYSFTHVSMQKYLIND